MQRINLKMWDFVCLSQSILTWETFDASGGVSTVSPVSSHKGQQVSLRRRCVVKQYSWDLEVARA